MTNKEKIIETLEYCVGMHDPDVVFATAPYTQCPYVDEDMCEHMIMCDALELLKGGAEDD